MASFLTELVWLLVISPESVRTGLAKVGGSPEILLRKISLFSNLYAFA
jgi:hypothetical protein